MFFLTIKSEQKLYQKTKNLPLTKRHKKSLTLFEILKILNIRKNTVNLQ